MNPICYWETTCPSMNLRLYLVYFFAHIWSTDGIIVLGAFWQTYAYQ